MALRAISNHILFAFYDKVEKGRFVDTVGAIEIPVAAQEYLVENSAKYARWGKTLAIGPEVTEIKVGDDILIDKLKWTEAFTHDGIKVWRTDENQILATR